MLFRASESLWVYKCQKVTVEERAQRKKLYFANGPDDNTAHRALVILNPGWMAAISYLCRVLGGFYLSHRLLHTSSTWLTAAGAGVRLTQNQERTSVCWVEAVMWKINPVHYKYDAFDELMDIMTYFFTQDSGAVQYTKISTVSFNHYYCCS